tara:strand:- start:193 stop:819 length:627 start_codon:yes stop_codon:yes gene_type:complete
VVQFLSSPPSPKTINSVVIRPLDGQRSFVFHPFLESYKHVVSPQVTKESFGLFSISTYFRNGITDNEFQVTIVLPAIDDKDAKNNYNKVQRFKRLVTPSVSELQKQTGLVKMSINPIMKRRIGYITSVNEDIDLEAGFAAGYPKVIRLSFTFSVDELYEATIGRTGGRRTKRPKPLGQKDQQPNEKKKTTTAARAQAAQAKKKIKAKT